jgi:hypothetical protein
MMAAAAAGLVGRVVRLVKELARVRGVEMEYGEEMGRGERVGREGESRPAAVRKETASAFVDSTWLVRVAGARQLWGISCGLTIRKKWRDNWAPLSKGVGEKKRRLEKCGQKSLTWGIG